MENSEIFRRKSTVKNILIGPRFSEGNLDIGRIGCDAYNHSRLYEQHQINKFIEKSFLMKDKTILIIYTGGTIGMEKTTEGLKPKKNYLYNKMYTDSSFCDQNYTLSMRKEGIIENDVISTPLTIYGKRIYYRIIEFNEIIDSSNMNLQYWKEIGSCINANYHKYDSFIILHGTDTMSYTASILSFQLENLNKTVILTGSQIPLSELRNDAAKNLMDAITLAGIYHIPEVCILFNSYLFRGNRTIKNDSFNLNAFESPNMPELGEIGINIKINWDLICKSPNEPFSYFEDIESSVSIIKFFPIMTDEAFSSFFNHSIKAVIIETYGAGNMPTDRNNLKTIMKNAIEKGILIINVSQCRKGRMNTAYEGGSELSKLGIIFAGDMTVECVLSKISYLMGKYKNDFETIKTLFLENLRGELTDIKNDVFFNENEKFCTPLARIIDSFYDNTKKEEMNELSNSLLPNVINDLVEKNQLNLLEKLKSEISSIDFKTYSKKNPLHVAALNGHEEIVRFLLTCNVNINDLDFEHNTPLDYAVMKKHEDIAKLLYEHGGILNQSNYNGQMFCNLAKNNDLDAIKLYFYCGADLMKGDYDNRTLAHIAAADDKKEIIEFLIKETQINIMVADRWGFTPIDDCSNEIKKIIGIRFKFKK